jgi:hypothetical protein
MIASISALRAESAGKEAKPARSTPPVRSALRRQTLDVVQRSSDDLILAFAGLRRRCDDKAVTENINRLGWVRPNAAALSVVAIPRLEVARARSDDEWRRAVLVECIGKQSRVGRIYVQDCYLAALAGEAEGVVVGELERRCSLVRSPIFK